MLVRADWISAGRAFLTDELADRLLESLRHENVSLVYARLPAQFGVIGNHV